MGLAVLFVLTRRKVTIYHDHSLKNQTGDRTGEAVDLGFHWSDHWFTGSMSGFL
jgi:hypothetical protein